MTAKRLSALLVLALAAIALTVCAGRAERRIIIKPETSPDCCLIWVEGSKRPPAVRWNPDADDLTSDTWEVTGDWYEP